jgi:hypothetical protein
MRITNIEQEISKAEVSAQNFIIGHSLFDIRYSSAFSVPTSAFSLHVLVTRQSLRLKIDEQRLKKCEAKT